MSKFVIKQIMFVIFCVSLMILYTANRYDSQQDAILIDSLRNHLQDVKYNVLTQSSELMNLVRQSNVEKKLRTTDDSLLRNSITPPFLIKMDDDDVVFRCNIVTLTENEPYEEKTILDHSSGEISTEDADILMDAVREAFQNETFRFYTGTSYRHITVWDKGEVLDMEPPHDHLGQVIGQFLPENPLFREMMKKSFDVLNNHPLNVQRAAEGKNKANSIWFWGAGTKPALQNFKEKTGLSGTMISAVDLLKGIAVGAGMEVVEVEGATGSLDTNYLGKASAAIKALLEDGQDFVYIHVEAPDEMGHQGNLHHKVQSIEEIDKNIVGVVKRALDASGEDYRIMVLPDHPTPIFMRTHTSDPVPFLIYDSQTVADGVATFDEDPAAATGYYVADGYRLMEILTK